MYRISKEETGKKIRRLMAWNNVTVREIQEEMELESPQAVYKWLNGRAIPSTENLLILSKLLNAPMEDMLVLDEESVNVEREKAWKLNHPRVFLSFKVWIEESVCEVDSRRFYHFLDAVEQERMRVACCAE